MGRKFSKQYYEKYALLSLIYCYNSKLSVLLDCKGESPDWQSYELGIGLEVVRAISEEEGELDSITNQLFGHGLSGEYIKKEVEKRFPKYVKNFEVVRNIACVSEDISFENNCIKAINSIIKKTNKLNNEYTVFNNNWLYMFANLWADAFNIEGLIDIYNELIFKLKFKRRFNKIFINDLDCIYVIEPNGCFTKLDLDSDMLARLKREASESYNDVR